MLTRAQIHAMLVPLGELYDKEITESLAGIYHAALRTYDEAAVRDALNRHLLLSKWFPKVSELRELIEGSTEGRCAEAWHCLRQTMERVGGYGSVAFADHGISAVVLAWGGWSKTCELTDEDLRYRQGDFRRLYTAHHERPGDVPRYLPGRTEAENRRAGYLDDIPAPTRIGFAGGQVQIGGVERMNDRKSDGRGVGVERTTADAIRLTGRNQSDRCMETQADNLCPVGG